MNIKFIIYTILIICIILYMKSMMSNENYDKIDESKIIAEKICANYKYGMSYSNFCKLIDVETYKNSYNFYATAVLYREKKLNYKNLSKQLKNI